MKRVIGILGSVYGKYLNLVSHFRAILREGTNAVGQQVSQSETWSQGPAVTLAHYTTWDGSLQLSQTQCSFAKR